MSSPCIVRTLSCVIVPDGKTVPLRYSRPYKSLKINNCTTDEGRTRTHSVEIPQDLGNGTNPAGRPVTHPVDGTRVEASSDDAGQRLCTE